MKTKGTLPNGSYPAARSQYVGDGPGLPTVCCHCVHWKPNDDIRRGMCILTLPPFVETGATEKCGEFERMYTKDEAGAVIAAFNKMCAEKRGNDGDQIST